MADRPILFSAPMIRALGDGSKTMTRRMLGKKGRYNIFEPGVWSDSYVMDPGNADWRASGLPCAAGDRLWVKETWRTHRAYDDLKPSDLGGEEEIWPEADGSTDEARGRIRQSIFMPRWASRMTLVVEEVRPERLWAITEEDAKAEGAIPMVVDEDLKFYPAPKSGSYRLGWTGTYRTGFMGIWASINGIDSWDANPWVAAILFRLIRANIDQEEARG